MKWILLALVPALLYLGVLYRFGNPPPNNTSPADGVSVVKDMSGGGTSPGGDPRKLQEKEKQYTALDKDLSIAWPTNNDIKKLQGGEEEEEEEEEIPIIVEDEIKPSSGEERRKKGETDVKTDITNKNTIDAKNVNKYASIENYRLEKSHHSLRNLHSNDGIQQLRENTQTAQQDTTETTTNKVYMRRFVNTLYKWAEYDKNFDAVLSSMGIGYVARTIAKGTKYQERLLENDVQDGVWDYILQTITVASTVETKFKLGVKVKYTSLDARHVTSVFSLVGKNVLEEQQTWRETDKTVKTGTVVREYSWDRMVMNVTTNDKATIQTFVAVR